MTRAAVGRWTSLPWRLRIGGLMLLVLIGLGVFAPLIARHSPTELDTDHQFVPPTAEFWMGTDQLGFDVFARSIFAIRIDLPLGVTAVAMSLTIGVGLGLLSGLAGGRVDGAIGRITDGFQAFPPLVLALLTATVLGASLGNLVLIIAVVYIPVFLRMARTQVLVLRGATFVEVARSLQVPWPRVAIDHLLPNMTGPLMAVAALAVGRSVVLAAGLGFLGLGPPPPTPEWGAMIGAGAEHLASGRWWVAFFPGLLLAMTVGAFALLGDGLQRIADPRIR